MPHVVVKANVDATETKVFGLSMKDFNKIQSFLCVYGGKVGQDGHTFTHPPLQVLNALETKLGYMIVSSCGQGSHTNPIWTLHRPFY